MAQEYEGKRYFNRDKLKYIDPYECNCLAIEYFLSRVIFHDKDGKPDGTRIIYAQDDMAWKERIQKMDSEGFDENTKVNVTTLNLPFSNYWRNKGAEPDDREASVTAAQMVIGDYDPLTFNFLKAMAIKTTFEGSLWFSNWDDAEVAYNLLHWEQNPKGPVWIYTPVKWYGVHLLIPSFITIDDLQLHPNYKESEWLETSKIIPINFKFTVRSYEVQVDKYDDIALPLRFGDKYKEKENVDFGTAVLTEKVTLDFMTFKEFTDTETDKTIASTDEQEASNLAYVKPGLGGLEQIDFDQQLMTDVVSSYFKDDAGVDMTVCKIGGATSTSLKVNLKVKPADQGFFDHIIVKTPGHKDVEITDCKTTGCVIEGLENNSEYHLTILVYAKDGSIKTFRLTGKTLDCETNEAPQPKATTAAKKKYPKLIGYEF